MLEKMRVAVLMCVKDEADIISECLNHWAAIGATDFYICDRGSADQTINNIKGTYLSLFDKNDRIRLVLFSREQIGFDNHILINKMKQSALIAGVNWMFPADADEFLLLPTGCETIQEWLSHYPQQPAAGTIPYLEGMNWHSHRKAFGYFVGHVPDMQISIGNHEVEPYIRQLDPKDAHYIHKPYRSPEQYRKKTINLMTAFKDGPTDNERHKQYIRWQAGGEAELEKIMQEHLSHTYPTWYYL